MAFGFPFEITLEKIITNPKIKIAKIIKNNILFRTLCASFPFCKRFYKQNSFNSEGVFVNVYNFFVKSDKEQIEDPLGQKFIGLLL